MRGGEVTRRIKKIGALSGVSLSAILLADALEQKAFAQAGSTPLSPVTVDAPQPKKKPANPIRRTARKVQAINPQHHAARDISAKPVPAVNTAPSAGGLSTGEQAGGPVQGYRASRSATSTKTDTAIRDSPQSIQVVPREVIVDQLDLRLSDALSNVSGVLPAGTIQGRSDTFTIRGFNTQTYAIDGVLLNPANTFSPVIRDLADAERIEVLKGPASVLYGRGDPGGLINIVTRKPTLQPSADVTIQGGSFDFKRIQGSASSAIAGSDSLAGRLSFAAQDDPTFRNYGGQHNQRYFIAPAFSWIPSADTRVYLNGEFTKQYSQYDEGLIAYNGRVPVTDLSRFYGEPYSRYFGESNFITFRAEHDFNNQLTIRQVANYQGGGFDLFATRATGVNATGTTVTRRDTGSTSFYNSVDTQTEAVAKFDTFGLKNTALLGFEYVDGYRNPITTQGNVASVSFNNPVFGTLPGAAAIQSDLVQKLRLYGTYIQDQIELMPGLQLVAGARFDVANQFYFSQTATNNTPPPNANLLGTSPRVGVVYRPWEPVTFYASYTTSFTPQTANVLNVSSPPPETGFQYEVGARADLIPDKLTTNFAAFQIVRNNVAGSDPNNSGYSVITGQQESRGFETDISGEIRPGWKIIGGGAYTDARITADKTFQVGNKLVGTPRFSGSLWSTYQIQQGVFRGLGAGLGITYVGRRYGDLNNSYIVGQYARLDASLFYDVNEHYRLAINARNLTNAHYIEQPFNQFNNMPGAPLTVLVSFTAKL